MQGTKNTLGRPHGSIVPSLHTVPLLGRSSRRLGYMRPHGPLVESAVGVFEKTGIYAPSWPIGRRRLRRFRPIEGTDRGGSWRHRGAEGVEGGPVAMPPPPLNTPLGWTI